MTDTTLDSSGSPTMFSFADIIHEIDRKLEKAKTGKGSWDRLREVALELAGAPPTADSVLAKDQAWSLEQVAIHNYRGVSNDQPLVITFDTSPGITVLHGPNGAGKSSISDAIELGLKGEFSAAPAGSGGKAPLWEPIPLARGADNARVEVTLSAGEQRLVFVTKLGLEGAVTSHSASFKDASDNRNVVLDATWFDALANHEPIFAYAALERKVQLSKDLAEYFEKLLALGGSFSRLHETIAERGKTANLAFDRWKAALRRAQQEIETTDADHGSASDISPLPKISTPAITDDLQQWLSTNGLDKQGVNSRSLPGNSGTALVEAATQTFEALSRYSTTGVSTEQLLSSALEQLHTEALSHGILEDFCPVCAAKDSKWATNLGNIVQRNRELSELRTKFSTRTKQLATAAGEILPLAFGAVDDSDDSRLKELSTLGKQHFEHFMMAIAQQPLTSPQSLAATTAFTEWICSPGAEQLLAEAIARTDATQQWRIARSAATKAFVRVWEEDGESASGSVLWGYTASRVQEIRKVLRKRRSTSLEGKAGQRIQGLLSDAELRLKSISVLSTKASMELVDTNGETVDLGMLSAGQRNAVLLAPLLASADGGPFGFLVLDDPVHAFDELRIDRLAELLSTLAKTRRVIVLTHDDRLKEHLAARIVQSDTRLVERSAHTGSVEVTVSKDFWHELLNDAAKIRAQAQAVNGSSTAVTDSVRRLCRMGVDNALRTFVMRNAIASARDVAADLQTVDDAYTTEQRLAAAQPLWQGPAWENPVSRAIRACESYLEPWNRSVHGNPPTSDVTSQEIDSARSACKKLAVVA